MAARRLVECRGDHFAFDASLHVGDLFWPFIDKQNDQEAFRVIRFDGIRDILKDHRFAGSGRRDDKRSLAFSKRRDKINRPGGPVLDRRVIDFHLQPLVRIERSQVVEMHRVPCHVRIFKVDLRHGHKTEVLFVLVRGPDHARDRGAGP